MKADDLFRAYQFTQLTLMRNLEGISHDESLQVPEGAENSINWILGHILTARAKMITLAGGTPHWSESEQALYDPASRAQFLNQPRPLDELKAALDDSLNRMESALQTAEPLFMVSTGRPPMFGHDELILHRLLFLAC
ncbi:MAG: DinB family protein, partial [Calditrichota bacterium]